MEQMEQIVDPCEMSLHQPKRYPFSVEQNLFSSGINPITRSGLLRKNSSHYVDHLLTRPDVEPLMLIGAYRGNEVNATHSLMRNTDNVVDLMLGLAELDLIAGRRAKSSTAYTGLFFLEREQREADSDPVTVWEQCESCKNARGFYDQWHQRCADGSQRSPSTYRRKTKQTGPQIHPELNANSIGAKAGRSAAKNPRIHSWYRNSMLLECSAHIVG